MAQCSNRRKKQDPSQVFCLDLVQLNSQDCFFPSTSMKSEFQHGSLPLRIVSVKYRITYSYRISNQCLTKLSLWGKNPTPAVYLHYHTYMQFKKSWGDSVVMGKAEGTSGNGAGFPAKPLTATCQEIRGFCKSAEHYCSPIISCVMALALEIAESYKYVLCKISQLRNALALSAQETGSIAFLAVSAPSQIFFLNCYLLHSQFIVC